MVPASQRELDQESPGAARSAQQVGMDSGAEKRGDGSWRNTGSASRWWRA